MPAPWSDTTPHWAEASAVIINSLYVSFYWYTLSSLTAFTDYFRFWRPCLFTDTHFTDCVPLLPFFYFYLFKKINWYTPSSFDSRSAAGCFLFCHCIVEADTDRFIFCLSVVGFFFFTETYCWFFRVVVCLLLPLKDTSHWLFLLFNFLCIYTDIDLRPLVWFFFLLSVCICLYLWTDTQSTLLFPLCFFLWCTLYWVLLKCSFTDTNFIAISYVADATYVQPIPHGFYS